MEQKLYNSSLFFKKKTLYLQLLKQYSLLQIYIEMISKIHKKEKGKKSKVGKWLHGVSLKLKSELTIIKKYCYWRNRENSGGISLTYLWSEFCSVSERLFLFTKSRTLTLLILAVCRMHVEYEPSIWPCSPWVLRSSSG